MAQLEFPIAFIRIGHAGLEFRNHQEFALFATILRTLGVFYLAQRFITRGESWWASIGFLLNCQSARLYGQDNKSSPRTTVTFSRDEHEELRFG